MEALGSVTVRATPEDVFSLLADPQTYPKLDTKITRATLISRSDQAMRLEVSGYVGLALMDSTFVLRVDLVPYQRVSFSSEPGSFSLPSRVVLQKVQGEFLLQPVAEGTKVLYSVAYVTKPTFAGRLADRLWRQWLSDNVEHIEMPRLRQLVEVNAADRHRDAWERASQ